MSPVRERTRLADITLEWPVFSWSVKRGPHVRPPSVERAAEMRAGA